MKRNETCGSVTVCTRDRPVRCMNNECVHDASECEKEVTCVRGFVMCDDGSCAPSYAACQLDPVRARHADPVLGPVMPQDSGGLPGDEQVRGGYVLLRGNGQLCL